MKHIFILLSGQQAPISSPIYEGKRSLKPPSTASQLILVRRLSFLYHHPPPSDLKPIPTTPINMPTRPSPQQSPRGEGPKDEEAQETKTRR